jgi:hypothetical protein
MEVDEMDLELLILNNILDIDLEKNLLKSALEAFDNNESNTILLGHIIKVKLQTVKRYLEEIEIYTLALKGLLC